MAPTPNGGKGYLTQLAANADSFQPDHIPDSCDEESSDDETPMRARTPPSRSHGRQSMGKENHHSATVTSPTSSRPSNKVLASVAKNSTTASPTPRELNEAEHYVVQWRKPQTKKHKTWDGDAYIVVRGNKIQMVDEKGDHMANGSFSGAPIVVGCELRIGQYEAEVDRGMTVEEYKSATCILNRTSVMPASVMRARASANKSFKSPSQISTPRPPSGYLPPRTAEEAAAEVASLAGPSRPRIVGLSAGTPVGRTVTADSFYAPKTKADKIVIGEKSRKDRLAWGGSLHDPRAEGAIVMDRVSDDSATKKRTEVVDVVVDPFLTGIMRPHQHEGVRFMYKCIMGLSGANAEGCILADEMGLGKTLQTIALIWTMLKQSPYANETSCLKKVLIVCPVTLVNNWVKEFKKWLQNRVGVVGADGTTYQISNFCNNKSQHVLVIGYERLRKVVSQLSSCQPPIDLIVCDEGHRLKSKDNKTTKMFDELRTTRRIILSGTPVQNDLGEYWAMVNFVCPGILDKYSRFHKNYEQKILRSRMPGASKAEVELGMERAQELSDLSKEFVIRRTADVLTNYLPPRHDYVLFVAPSPLQLEVFAKVLNPTVLGLFLREGSGMMSFSLIDLLRKVCNAPSLLRKKDDEGDASGDIGTAREAALSVIPKAGTGVAPESSGKLLMLDRLLQALFKSTEEKVVIVSNWTSTLDIIESLCKSRSYALLRLDGKTSTKERQPLVDKFNRGSRRDSFAFLLSAKAGGVGLNLIGASRLILFDSDWNPSTDLQAMGRVHRDGQKKPVYIYRLLTACTIDEKIYQRQIIKTGLSDQMLDGGKAGEGGKDSFSLAELRDIFSLNTRTDGCQTHDLLGCDCASRRLDVSTDSPPTPESPSLNGDEDEVPKFVPAAAYDPEPTPAMLKRAAEEKKQKLLALKKWTHVDGTDSQSFADVHDEILYNILWEEWDSLGSITSVKKSAGSTTPPSAKNGRANKRGRHSTSTFSDTITPPDTDGIETDDEFDQVLEGKRKVSDKSKGRSLAFGSPGAEKRHDLQAVAQAGGTGKIMFILEKVKKAKMDP